MKRYSQLIMVVTGTVALAGAATWLYDHDQDRRPEVSALSPMPITQIGKAEIALDPMQSSTPQWQQQQLAFKAVQDGLAHDIQALKKKLAQLTDMVSAAKANSETEMWAEPEADDLPSLEELKAQEAVMMAAIEDEFRMETLDTAQGVETENEIAANLQARAFKGTTLVDIECRTVSCRIEARHEDQAAMENFAAESPHLIPWDSDGVTQILEEGDGSLRTVSYFKRVL